VGNDPTGSGPGEGGSGPVHVGGHIRPPTKLRHVNPEYPELARRAGVGGEVVLECLIDVNGEVTDVRVLSGNPLLREAAARLRARLALSTRARRCRLQEGSSYPRAPASSKRRAVAAECLLQEAPT
jgi:TonB family protein